MKKFSTFYRTVVTFGKLFTISSSPSQTSGDLLKDHSWKNFNKEVIGNQSKILWNSASKPCCSWLKCDHFVKQTFELIDMTLAMSYVRSHGSKPILCCDIKTFGSCRNPGDPDYFPAKLARCHGIVKASSVARLSWTPVGGRSIALYKRCQLQLYLNSY